MKSRAGIYYDLKASPYCSLVKYGCFKIKYVFSSELYLSNFTERMKANREEINSSLAKRFKLNLEVDVLADLKLYSSIEKRGFLIFLEDKEVECLNDIRLNGLTATSKS